MQRPTTDTLKWLAAWKAAGERMEQLRKQDLAHLDIADVIEALDDAFESARQHVPPSSTSGLVEQQALFKKGRR